MNHRLIFRLLPAVFCFIIAVGSLSSCTKEPSAELAHSPVTLAAALPLDERAVREDIALARRALEDIHPGYDRYVDAKTLQTAWGALEEKAASLRTDIDLYLALSGVLSQIRCDHTKAELPPTLKKARLDKTGFFPFRLIVDGKNAYIYSVTEGSALRKGDKILSINGHPMPRIIDNISAYIPVDGYTDFVKHHQFEATGEFLGSGFEHFYPLLYGDWTSATLIIERAGTKITIEVAPILWSAWQKLDWPGQTYRANFKDSVDLEIDENGTAILTINTFVNYRDPVNPVALYRPIFERLQDEQVHTLILDTRLNGGGSDDAATGLLAFLLEEPVALFQWKRVRMIDFSAYSHVLNVWDPDLLTPDANGFIRRNDGWYDVKPETDPVTLMPITLEQPRFTGNVIALSSGANASGITLLLATLQETKRAQIIGERTGGSAEGPTAGSLYFLKLPNSGITVRIPWQRQRSIVADPNPGLGVTPDLIIAFQATDKLSGNDPVLETALSRAKTQNQEADVPSRQ